jgi:uncharacterized NAD(P)/FAD-binding protein YdhS
MAPPAHLGASILDELLLGNPHQESLLRSKTIVCIGAGASATLVAYHLDRLGFRGRIVLADRHPGNGPAYASCDHRHVLNVPAGNMGAATDDPAGFLHWLNHLGIDPPVDAADFVPRQLYGLYLDALIEPLRADGRVIRMRGGVCGLAREATRWRVELERGAAIQADAVVLAIGNLPPRMLPGAELTDERLVVNDPWRCRLEDIIGPHRRVLFVGTVLTMVDGVLSLAPAARNGVHLTALSRHGHLPLPWGTQESLDFHAPVDAAPSLRGVLQQLRQRVEAGDSWECLMNGLRVKAQFLWTHLSPADQARFLRHGRALWAIHRHRIPDKNHETLRQLRQAGQLEILPARLESLRQVGNRVQARWRRRGQASCEKGWFDLVVNATGPEAHYERSRDPLLRQLFAAGHVRAHPLGLGLDATPAGALRGADGAISPGLHSLGAPMQGVLLECTAIPDIRRSAEQLAGVVWQDLQARNADKAPSHDRREGG